MGTIIADLGKIERDIAKLRRALAVSAGALVDARALVIRRLGHDSEDTMHVLADLDAALAELRELGMEV